ncbi:MAG TPA: ABC transporter ATP-binding protein [Herpetosiphonaceae bacterium]|nr:ABC transporter ATP-binding protein [Herpetosiphonaceae bacterium]
MSRREFTVPGEYVYNRKSPGRWIVSHLLRYPWLPVVAAITGIGESVMLSYGAVVVGQAFNLLLSPQRGAAGLLRIAAFAVGVRLAQALLLLVVTWAFEMIGKRLERDAREELMISLLGKSQTFHNRQQVGDVMARATNDMGQLSTMISPGVSLIFSSMMSLVSPIVLIGLLQPKLLLTPLLFTVVFFWAIRDYMRQLNPVAGAERHQFGVMNAGLAETVAGIEVVKAYAQEPAARAKFARDARSFRDFFVKEGQIQARYLPLLLFGIMFGAGFAHALYLYVHGAISVGTIISFMGLLGILRFPTFISIFTFSLVQMGLASAERILELINAETELDENRGGVSQPVRGEIAFRDVSYGYGDAPLLKHISFTARPGETIAIVGQTGSGKSTLTKLVNRTYDVTDGQVCVDGVDVREWSIDSLRSQISTIEQDIFLFSRSIAENIGFGAAGAATREQIEQAAREAQAHEFIMKLPDGYDTVIGERGVTLSGGQRQRLAIARALLTDPRILILDDSTSAIDSATEDQIQRAMRRVLQGRTTLLITHRLSQIRWADRILVLRRGELVDQGTHDELLQRSEAYRRIFVHYDMQLPADETVADGEITPTCVGA